MAKNITFIAFDFGTKKIGVAVGQMITMTASPLACLPSNAIWEHVLALIAKWQPGAFIVGLPLNMDGTTQPITKKARAFAKGLQQRFEIPVHTVDERLTTVEAKQMLFDLGGYKALKNTSVDSFAAKLMLESWMRHKTEE